MMESQTVVHNESNDIKIPLHPSTVINQKQLSNLDVLHDTNEENKQPDNVRKSSVLSGNLFHRKLSVQERTDSFLYLSRLDDDIAAGNLYDDNSSVSTQSETTRSIMFVDNSSILNPNSDISISGLNPKQQLAITLRNWSSKPENHAFMILEGAIHALITLSTIEDRLIKECCATAFYYLSSERKNVEDIMNLGAVHGIISLSMLSRGLKLSKLCAITMYNISLHEKGCIVLAKERALIALMILWGRGTQILEICVKTMYNITTADYYFKDLERIIKALLNLPASIEFDHYPYLLKSMTNAMKYHDLRIKFIDDGALSMISLLIQSLSKRDNKDIFIQQILACLLLLSESPSCKVEMLVRGVMDILWNFLVHCQVSIVFTREYIKIVYNLLHGSKLNIMSYETSCKIIFILSTNSSDEFILQYCSSILNLLSRDSHSAIETVNTTFYSKVLELLSKFLSTNDGLSQYYAILLAGSIFFNSLITDMEIFRELFEKIIDCGHSLRDDYALQALAHIVSKLSQDSKYSSLLSNQKLLSSLIQLLLDFIENDRININIRDSCSIALSRIVITLEIIDFSIVSRVSKAVSKMFESEDLNVLLNSISSAKILGNRNQFQEAFQSNNFLNQIICIMQRFPEEDMLIRTCCAVIAILSYKESSAIALGNISNLTILYNCVKKKDTLIHELLSTIFCNISALDSNASILANNQISDHLATLSSSNLETIQELCAKCICNLSRNTSIHSILISSNILDVLLMITLVRSSDIYTKQFCVKALFNFVTDENIPHLRKASAVRVFSSLSSSDDSLTRSICARGFFIYTTTIERCEDIIRPKSSLISLMSLVKWKSSRTRLMVGLAVCNLLGFETSRKDAIVAGALAVLKIIATLDFEELHIPIASVILTLAKDSQLHSHILRQPIIPILVHLLLQSRALEVVIHALSCLSQYEVFRSIMIERGVTAALVNTILTGKMKSEVIALEITRCFLFLSYHSDRINILVKNDHIMLALHLIAKSKYTNDTIAKMLVVILRNLSFEESIRSVLVEEKIIKLLDFIIKSYPLAKQFIHIASLYALYNLSFAQSIHSHMIEEGFFDIIFSILNVTHNEVNGELTEVIAHLNFALTSEDMMCILKSMEVMSLSDDGCLGLANGPIVMLFEAFLNNRLRKEYYVIIAMIIANIASWKHSREILVAQEPNELIMRLSDSSDPATQHQCSLALGHLSQIASINAGVVQSMLVLSKVAIADALQTPNEAKKTYLAIQSGSNDEELKTMRIEQRDLRQVIKKTITKRIESTNIITNMQNDVYNEMKSKNRLPFSPTSYSKFFEDYSILENNLLNKEYAEYEMSAFIGNYKDMIYKTVILPSQLEEGGTANDFDVEVGIPTVAGGKMPNVFDRTDDMMQLSGSTRLILSREMTTYERLPLEEIIASSEDDGFQTDIHQSIISNLSD